MICRFLKKIFGVLCCAYSDPDEEDDVYNALHNDECVRVTNEDIKSTSPSSFDNNNNNNRYSLSDDPSVSYDQIYQIYYRQ